ncbi:MAG: hypothetical protein ABJB73_12465 [Candidatus Nitrosocosmicus sp.]
MVIYSYIIIDCIDDVSLELLNNAYRKETNLLVRRVRIDRQEVSKVAEKELHKS